jgi:GH18 family chitinase
MSYTIDPLESRLLLSRRVIGYFPDWEASGLLNKTDWTSLTHVNYFSIVPSPSGALPAATSSGYSFALMDNVVTTAHAHGVSVSIVVGGAGLDSTIIPIASDSTKTATFITNMKSFCAAHSFDGIDFDWEPAWGTATVAQITAYGNLLNAFKQQAPHLMLSAAVNPGLVPTDAGSRYVVPTSAVNSLDVINVMAYDFQIPDHSNYAQSTSALAAWGNYAAPAGVPKSRIVLGVPFYAHENSWATAKTYQSMLDTYPVLKTDPTLDNAGGWYFNNRTTIQNKSQYVVNNGFGGVMIWQLAQDHFTNNAIDQYSLLPVIKNTLGLPQAPFATLSDGTLTIDSAAASAGTTTFLSQRNGTIAVVGIGGYFSAPAASVSSIVFTGTSGNDSLNVNGFVTVPITFTGTAGGNDTVGFSAYGPATPASAMLDGDLGSNVTAVVYANATANFNATQHLASLKINDGGAARMTADGGRALVTKALTLAGTGTLDLNDNNLIIDYTTTTPLPAVQSLINAARSGGTWTGSGITSSSAKNNPTHNTTLGAMEASEFKNLYGASALFDGESIDSTAVLVKYTYYGDTDFNGQVNFDDYVRTDSGFNNHMSGWLNGDFDGNGQVNFDDYVLIDLAFNTHGSALRHVHPLPVLGERAG